MTLDKKYITNIKEKLNLEKLKSILNKLKSLNVLVIGDIIIDEYIFVLPKGRAIKDPILSVEYENHETYAGGALAMANHLSDYVNDVSLIALIGDHNSKIDFIEKSLEKGVKLKTFVKEKSPTIIKKRYIDSYRNNKLFKIEYMNDKPISEKLTEEIVDYLDKELVKYDLVIVGDFGHGFINQKIRSILEQKSKFLSINAQSNSANMGYNYINNYQKAHFITLDEKEIRLPLMKRFEKIEDVAKEFNEKFKFKKFLVTRGKNDTLLFNNGFLHKAPVLVDTIVDSIGAGDAVCAISSLLIYTNARDELVPFIANCVGGIECNIMGNKENVTKEKLLNFIEKIYKNELE